MTILEFSIRAVLESLPEYFFIIPDAHFWGDLRKESNIYVFLCIFLGPPKIVEIVFSGYLGKFSILHNLAELPSCKAGVSTRGSQTEGLEVQKIRNYYLPLLFGACLLVGACLPVGCDS